MHKYCLEPNKYMPNIKLIKFSNTIFRFVDFKPAEHSTAAIAIACLETALIKAPLSQRSTFDCFMSDLVASVPIDKVSEIINRVIEKATAFLDLSNKSLSMK